MPRVIRRDAVAKKEETAATTVKDAIIQAAREDPDGGHFEYEILVTYFNLDKVSVFRRYRKFDELVKNVEEELGKDGMDDFPKLPSKKLFGRNKKVAEERIPGLQLFIDTLVGSPFKDNYYVKSFLTPSLDDGRFFAVDQKEQEKRQGSPPPSKPPPPSVPPPPKQSTKPKGIKNGGADASAVLPSDMVAELALKQKKTVADALASSDFWGDEEPAPPPAAPPPAKTAVLPQKSTAATGRPSLIRTAAGTVSSAVLPPRAAASPVGTSGARGSIGSQGSVVAAAAAALKAKKSGDSASKSASEIIGSRRNSTVEDSYKDMRKSLRKTIATTTNGITSPAASSISPQPKVSTSPTKEAEGKGSSKAGGIKTGAASGTTFSGLKKPAVASAKPSVPTAKPTLSTKPSLRKVRSATPASTGAGRKSLGVIPAVTGNKSGSVNKNNSDVSPAKSSQVPSKAVAMPTDASERMLACHLQNGDVRNFKVPPKFAANMKYQELYPMLCGFLQDFDVVLNYKDTDGDMVALRDQEDLDLFLLEAPSATKLELHLTSEGDYSVYNTHVAPA